MPNSYGHAKDFFDKSLNDKEFNQERGLLQFRNVRTHRPLAGDIIIYDGDSGNPFGHIGIITEVGDDFVELIQQNIGTKTRQKLKLVNLLRGLIDSVRQMNINVHSPVKWVISLTGSGPSLLKKIL